MRASRITRRAAIAALALGALSACGSSTTLSTPVVGASLLVNRDKAITRQMEVPTLFVERNDPNLLYLSGVELITGKCRFFTSTDHGYTWTEGTAPLLAPYTNCSAGSGQPLNFRTTMAEGSDGTLFLAYASHDPSAGGARSALLARSTDRGHNWTVTVIDAPPAPTPPDLPEVDFEPHVTVDPGDAKHVVVIWRRSKEHTPTRPYIATSTDGGASFSKPAMLFDKTMGFDPPYPVIVNGTLAITWHQTFPKPSGGGDTPPDKIWFSTSSDGGKTWTDNQISTGANADTPVLLYDTTRSRYDVFWDANGSSGDLDIFFSSSSDGKSWSSPVRVNDDPTSDHREQQFPIATLAPNGRVDVAFYDFRNDPYPVPKSGDLGSRQDVYESSSTDGGATWSANLRLNDVPINRTIGTWNNEYYIVVPPAIASGDGWALGVWSDTRLGDQSTGTQDLFAAPLAYDTSTIPQGYLGATSPGYSKSDLAVVGVVIGIAALLGGAGVALLAVATMRRRRPEEA